MLSVDNRFRRMLSSAEGFERGWRQDAVHNYEYYDGEQWSAEDRIRIESRGQQPTVINTIQPIVDMVRSLEVDRRTDIQVVGREESDDDKAVLLTALLKYVFDRSDMEYYHSEAFKDACIGGIGWMEVGIRTDSSGRKDVVVDHVNWEDMYVDPFSRKPDCSDARFIIRVKWVDKDLAKLMFPDDADQIESSYPEEGLAEREGQLLGSDRGVGSYYDRGSHRIKICECYYSRYVKDGGSCRRRIHFVIFSGDIVLRGSPDDDSLNGNPLGIDYYPFVPIIANKDRKNHPRGIVSPQISIQDQINKLNSKYLYNVSSNRLFIEEGAARDMAEAIEEFNRPDGAVRLQPGGLARLRGDDNRSELNYISAHLNFLLAVQQRISGVNDSMLGFGGTNERSGVMQATRINQGASMQTSLMQNMFFSKERISLIVLRLIGRHYKDHRVIRITQPNGTLKSYEFNRRGVDDSGSPFVFNDIDDTLKYDVVLKKVPPFNSLRDRMLTIFSEIVKSGIFPPEIAGKIVLSLVDMPNKEDILFELEQRQRALEQQAVAQQGAAPQGM